MQGKINFRDGHSDDILSDGLERHDHAPAETGMLRVNLFKLLALFLRQKRWIAMAVAAVMVITSLIVLFAPGSYTSQATILPSGKPDKISELKDLAGLGGGSGKDENSSELFPIILQSQAIGQALLEKEYTFQHDSRKITLTLAKYFRTANPAYLLASLAKITSIAMDRKTGVITATVTTRYPELSQAVLKTYLSELDNFNIHKRCSQAKDVALYLEKQLRDLKPQLEEAEDRLEQFQNVNRSWAATTSPEIVKMLGRYQREIETKSRAFLALQQEYEMAKLNEQKDVPIVRILDYPSLPTIKSGPGRVATVILSGIVTFVTSLIVIVILYAFAKAKSGPDRESFESLQADFAREFPSVNRLVGRLKGVQTAARSD